MPAEIHDNVLEANVWKALSLTGINAIPEDLHACPQMERSDRLIIKFKCHKQKQSVMHICKNLGTKSQKHLNLKFPVRLFVGENMSHENQ